MTRYDYVIIGNSAGAVGCIEGLRNVDKTGKLAVISDEGHHAYSRALIPYLLKGKISRENIYYRPLDFYEKYGATPFLGVEAVGLDPEGREIELSGGGKIGYGKLLLAAGGKPFVPPVAGLDKKNIFTFLSLQDALGIEESLAGVRNAVVLGGGVIGLMAAEVLKRKGLSVCVLELAERVLAPVVDETASDMVETLFKEKGIEIYTRTTVEEVYGQEEIKGLILNNGRMIPCDLLIVAIGVAPRVELARSAGIKINRGVIVDKTMQTSSPDIYACGDCAEAYDFITQTARLVPLWPNAYVGGRIAGYNMAGERREYVWGTGMNAMHFFDVYIINAGLNVTGENAGDFELISRLDKNNRVYRKFALLNGRIQGLILVGEVARAGIFLNLMRRKIDVRGFREELLRKDFGYGHMPGEIRWQLLKDDVLLGVV